jgi:flavin-dependent dehydrogenase
MTPEIQTQCDVVVIGAGISGLTAAALLSKAGLHVVVVEAQSGVGGCIAGFERKGFKFDSAIHWLCKMGSSLLLTHVVNQSRFKGHRSLRIKIRRNIEIRENRLLMGQA